MAELKGTKELLKHLELEELEDCSYLGNSEDIGSPNIFGGQVLAQSLAAATKTVEKDRLAHSIHSYFFLPGDFQKPVLYKVEKIRDGRSFNTRNVKALQNEKVIYECVVSFQREEKSPYNHQFKKPVIFRIPKFLISWDQVYSRYKDKVPAALAGWLAIVRPLEIKQINFENFIPKIKWAPKSKVWFRFKEAKDLEISYPQLQQMLLYASDYNILMTALNPYPKANMANTQMATIDHAMWFHRKFSASDTFLYTMDSPSASNNRAFTRGFIYTKKGVLVASVTQEGLMRKKKKLDK